ncbi:hepatitis A virus cellular receptor 1 homolog [Labrus bergylta]|uniref:hepatitis A virus cellular receptor 1 homolog n=1 Tax=Labrus bergylta TaxID=56723 RepID=UPI0033141CAC
MNELKWIQTSLLLTALLQFAAAFLVKRVTFRVGEDATLSCQTVIQGQRKCEYTTWFLDLGNNAAVELVVEGQVRRNSRVKSDRLRVTEDCSLVIKKIREEDAGRYECLQYISGGRTGDVTGVLLSVTKSENTKPEPTRPTTRPPITRPPPTTTRPPSTRPPPTTPTRPPITTIRPPPTTTTRPPPPTTTKPPTTTAATTDWRWWLIFVPVVVFIVLLMVVVKVIRRKGNRTQMSDDVADPEGGVSYASIRYNKKGKREARVCAKDDADDGSVTYASVKASSSSTAAGASADPSILYATINKEKK